MTGRWKCDTKTYQQRVDTCVNDMHDLTTQFGIRPANVGKGIFTHEYRAANTRADELTHQAREGRTFYRNYVHFRSYEAGLLIPIAYRGAYDGGVCGKGSACGFWLQAGYLDFTPYHSYLHTCSTSPPHVLHGCIIISCIMLMSVLLFGEMWRSWLGFWPSRRRSLTASWLPPRLLRELSALI